MKTVIFALLSILILSSCVTRGKMTGVHEGMTKAEVIRAAGDPDGYQRSGEYEVLFYIDRSAGNWSAFSTSYRDVVDYSVILKDDHVVEYGPGRTHQRASGATPFVRMPAR
ncbi:hypothetical protein [Nitrosovibrio sp. Nv4]|uniref:hypothetical protein n=1 Tax=Nitrosovibrio sp. Nv4 TaxID=1945880 RepID=UPI000BD88B0C|nr:hypothetical protein [Nitrosovibrio sp. Nv4]SOD41800.1 hypothetical protein SAMN06298226_2103 [Nitrosovibrio sp. Nv4]